MPERITGKMFQEAGGTDDWRVLGWGAHAWFAAADHATGAELVSRAGRLADDSNHHPDVALRRGGVRFSLFTHEIGGLSGRDVDMARAISRAAAELGLVGDPSVPREVNLTIDAIAPDTVMPFWEAVLGYERADHDLVDPHRRWSPIWFQEMEAPRPLRNRIHLDVFLPAGVAADRIRLAVAAGGRIAAEWEQPHRSTTLADPEGNEADVPFHSRDEGLPEGWSSLQGATTRYGTDSFSAGVALVEAAATLADEADKPLIADLRYRGVTFRLGTPEDGGMDTGSTALASRIHAAAGNLDIGAAADGVMDLMISIDAVDIDRVRPFWAAALGYAERGEEDLYDPQMIGPAIWFQQMDEPRPQRNRIHVDAFVPDDQAQARIAAAIAAGGTVVYDDEAPEWWTLADPEGNEVDIAVSVGREELWMASQQG